MRSKLKHKFEVPAACNFYTALELKWKIDRREGTSFESSLSELQMRRVREEPADGWMDAGEEKRTCWERRRRALARYACRPRCNRSRSALAFNKNDNAAMESASTAKWRERKADLDARPHGGKLNLHAHYAITYHAGFFYNLYDTCTIRIEINNTPLSPKAICIQLLTISSLICNGKGNARRPLLWTKGFIWNLLSDHFIPKELVNKFQNLSRISLFQN
jgi:hypothetical protein